MLTPEEARSILRHAMNRVGDSVLADELSEVYNLLDEVIEKCYLLEERLAIQREAEAEPDPEWPPVDESEGAAW